MINKILYYISNHTNVHYNIAVEEFLFHKIKKGVCVLYLWQNENAVVIGKNQNCRRECNLAEMKRDNVLLARRLSGGGAVYHDLENLNFTFLTSKENYDTGKHFQVIAGALKKYGIDVWQNGRNDMEIHGKKFSGNAFFHGAETSFHHGTLLVNVSMEKMACYLNVSKEKLKSKGVESVPSRVTNLKQLKEEITIEGLKEKLIESFGEIYGKKPEKIEEETILENEVLYLKNKFESPEWCFRPLEAFEIEKEKRFEWGELQMQILIKEGRIKNANFFSDAMETEFINTLGSKLTGLSWEYEKLMECIKNINSKEEEESIKEDICQWIKEQE